MAKQFLDKDGLDALWARICLLIPDKNGTGATGEWDIDISGTAAHAPWAGITGKPTSFTPSGHTHSTTLAGSHNHTFTGSAVNTNSTGVHNHTFTGSAVTSATAGSHTHTV